MIASNRSRLWWHHSESILHNLREEFRDQEAGDRECGIGGNLAAEAAAYKPSFTNAFNGSGRTSSGTGISFTVHSLLESQGSINFWVPLELPQTLYRPF